MSCSCSQVSKVNQGAGNFKYVFACRKDGTFRNVTVTSGNDNEAKALAELECDQADAEKFDALPETHLVNADGETYWVEDGKATLIDSKSSLSKQSNCQGNACSDLSITWEGGSYNFRNTGGQRIRVTVKFAMGWSCLEPKDIDLDPGQEYKSFNSYCVPAVANYI